MDWGDPFTDTLRKLPQVPNGWRFKKSKNGNTEEITYSVLVPETSSDEENVETEAYEKKLLEIRLKLAESTGAFESDEARDFARFDDLFNGQLPCTLLYLDRNSSRLRAFKKFDELSNFLVTADENPSTPNDRVIEMLQSAHAGRLVHYTTLGKYLQHLYKEDRFMDVHIDVHGTSFMAHRIVLCCHSGYFKKLFNQNEMRVKIPIRMKVFGVSVEAFAAFIEYIYTGRICINNGIISDIIYISDFLDVKSLKDKLYSMTGSLTLEQAIRLLLRPCDPSGNLYYIAFVMIVNRFNEASMIVGFLDINVDIFCCIIQSDDLRVSREYEVFQVVVRWIVHGGRERIPYITKVMSNIRFCHMTEEELFDCLEETNLFLDHTDLRYLILIANWVHTAMRLKKPDPFHFHVPPRRTNYSHYHQNKTFKHDQRHPPLHCTMENITSTACSSEESSQRTSSMQSSKLSGKHTFPQQPNEPHTYTSKQRSRSPRYGKPVIVNADPIINEPSTKWNVKPVITAPGYRENIKQRSPNFGKPVVLPPELQLPVDNSIATALETNIVQRTPPSPAEQVPVTSTTKTSSNDSNPEMPPSPAYHNSLPSSDISANEYQKVISPEAGANISNHSPRHGHPLSLPQKDDVSEAENTHEQPNISEGIIQQPTMSPISHSTPDDLSTDSSNEHEINSEVQTRAVGLQIKISESSRFPKVPPITQRRALTPECHKRPNAYLPSSKQNPLRQSARYSKPILLPSSDSQKPGIENRPSKSRVRNGKLPVWPPDKNDESTPTQYRTEQVKTSLPHQHLVFQPSRGQVEVKLTTEKKCDCRQVISPTCWSSRAEYDRNETDALKDQKDINFQQPTMSPPIGRLSSTMWSPNPKRCSNSAANGDKDSPDLSIRSENVSSSTDSDEFVDASDIKSDPNETTQWFEAVDNFEDVRKAESCMPQSLENEEEMDKHDVQPNEKKLESDISNLVPVSPDIIIVGFLEGDKLSDEVKICGRGIAVEFCNIPEPRYGFAVARVGREVYLIGGGQNAKDSNNGRKITNTVLQMDCFVRDCVQVASMNEARMNHSACVLDSNIYVFGGLDENDSPLASCEYYNPNTNTWTSITPMPLPVYAGAAAALGGKCYIAGGMTHKEDELTPRLRMIMISYDPVNKKWSLPGYLRLPLCHAALVNVQGRLLLCGGATYKNDRSSRRELVSVDTIDEYNIITNSWRFRTKMSSARQEFSAVAVGSKLYVIGGKNNADDSIIQSVDCYDTHASIWKDCGIKVPSSVRDIKCLSCQNIK